MATPPLQYRTVAVNGLDVFYREAGPAEAPVLLLLHGFPTSSHMFRQLLPLLADRYRVLAPDLPGFGFTTSPPATEFTYTFDHLAEVMDGFTQALGLARYALYIFDYGAPVGLRLALAYPERVTALITQNGNAYEEGLSDEWVAPRAYWQHPTPANRAALRAMYTWEAGRARGPGAGLLGPGPPRPRRNATGPHGRLPHQRGLVPPLPRILPHPPPAHARRVGRK
jgi:pimeloyl-ACP methyl ester carboxylesterase